MGHRHDIFKFSIHLYIKESLPLTTIYFHLLDVHITRRVNTQNMLGLLAEYYMYVGIKYAWLAYLLSLQIFKTYVLHKDNCMASLTYINIFYVLRVNYIHLVFHAKHIMSPRPLPLAITVIN